MVALPFELLHAAAVHRQMAALEKQLSVLDHAGLVLEVELHPLGLPHLPIQLGPSSFCMRLPFIVKWLRSRNSSPFSIMPVSFWRLNCIRWACLTFQSGSSTETLPIASISCVSRFNRT